MPTNLYAPRELAVEGVPREQAFLNSLVLDHGPVELLGRLFARANAEAARRGVTLSFGNAGDLVAANEANRRNWLPLAPTLSSKYNDLDAGNFFCVLARNGKGDVIGAHAARLFDWSATNFVTEAENLRLFYRDPASQMYPDEVCEVDGIAARTITGSVVYSGAAWVHPDYRGKQLSDIIPRVAKAYILTKWRPGYIASIMTEAVYRKGFAPRFGYDNIVWSLRWRNSVVAPDLRFAIVWMDEAHLVSDLQSYLAGTHTEIDAVVGKRRA